VIDFLRFLGPGTHVMAVCQPSVPVMAAVALMNAMNDPATPRTMTLMGGPIDTRRNPTVPNKLATERSLAWF
ncbi:polyhydroxyalkanoate depolymerase, partial [Escherichia coli]